MLSSGHVKFRRRGTTQKKAHNRMKCVSYMQWCEGVWLITVTGGGKWKYDCTGPVGVNFQE